MGMAPFPILALLMFIEICPLAVLFAALVPILLVSAAFTGIPNVVVVVPRVIVANAGRAARANHDRDHCCGKQKRAQESSYLLHFAMLLFVEPRTGLSFESTEQYASSARFLFIKHTTGTKDAINT